MAPPDFAGIVRALILACIAIGAAGAILLDYGLPWLWRLIHGGG